MSSAPDSVPVPGSPPDPAGSPPGAAPPPGSAPAPGNGRRCAQAPLRWAFHGAHVLGHALYLARHRLRRARLVTGLRVKAVWHRADLELHVAGDLRLGRRVRIVLLRQRRHRLWIGPGCTLGDDVRIELGGGSVWFGRQVEIRRLSELRVSGELVIAGPAVLSQGCTIHCDESIRFGERVIASEYTTFTDSSHRHGDATTWQVHHVVTAPVQVDADAWVAAKASVTRGVHVGARAVVGANSAVVRDVPPGAMASGVPAVIVAQASPARPGVRRQPRPSGRPVPVPGGWSTPGPGPIPSTPATARSPVSPTSPATPTPLPTSPATPTPPPTATWPTPTPPPTATWPTPPLLEPPSPASNSS